MEAIDRGNWELISAERAGTQGQAGEPKPVGKGPFGNIYDQFKGKAKEAVDFLTKKRSGEAVGALHHKDVGDIDLVWGEEGTGHSDGYGLAKLLKYHPDVLDNLQEILDDMHVVSRSDNRINLESDTHRAAVRLTWNKEKKTWLLTAFEKKSSVPDNTTDTAETPEGKRNDTATPQNATSSADKGTTNTGNAQGGGAENAQVKTESWRDGVRKKLAAKEKARATREENKRKALQEKIRKMEEQARKAREAAAAEEAKGEDDGDVSFSVEERKAKKAEREKVEKLSVDLEETLTKLNVPRVVCRSAEEMVAAYHELTGKTMSLERARNSNAFVDKVDDEDVVFFNAETLASGKTAERAAAKGREITAHEVLGHYGLPVLMGEEGYKRFCNQVYGSMSEAARERFNAYYFDNNLNRGLHGDILKRLGLEEGTRWNELTSEQKAQVMEELGERMTKGAADEYIAHLAERVERGEVLPKEEKTLWDSIVDYVRRMLGFDVEDETFGDRDIAKAIMDSKANLEDRARLDDIETEIEEARERGDKKAEKRLTKERDAIEKSMENRRASVEREMDHRDKLAQARENHDVFGEANAIAGIDAERRSRRGGDVRRSAEETKREFMSEEKEDEAIGKANERFNGELDAFAKGDKMEAIHLGVPSSALRASGLNGTEMFVTPRTLRKHLDKHGLTVDDIRDLPKALQNPLMVYEWGDKAKSLIAITEIGHGNDRITVAVKLERGGKRVEVNEIASVHAKETSRFMNEMTTPKKGGLKEALRWVGDKEKALEWLGMFPPKGTPSLAPEELSVAKVIENFENPKLPWEKVSSEGENSGDTRFSTEDETRRRAGEMAVEALRKKGVDVVTDADEMQRVLDEVRKERKGGQQMLFAGEKGMGNVDRAEATARLDDLSVAREMEQSGKDAKAIKIATGWERGADGKWRYEIPDFGVDLEALKDNGENDYYTKKRPLGSVLTGAEELFGMYPQLKNIKVKMGDSEDMGNVIASYDRKGKTVTIADFAPEMSNGFLEKTITHEIQHVIQGIEGFAEGGNDEMRAFDKQQKRYKEAVRRYKEEKKRYEKWLDEKEDELDELDYMQDEPGYETHPLKLEHDKRRKQLIDAEQDIYVARAEVMRKIYKELAGEVEARNAGKRRGLTAEERRQSLGSETEDVAREDQVVRHGLSLYDTQGRSLGKVLQFLKTADGEILGFVHEGKVYIDPASLDANTPVHEYTHLWDTALRKSAPKLWQEGVELMKQTSLWEEVKNDPHYRDIAGDENLLASEVHSRLTGEEGRKYFEKLAKEAEVAKGPLEKAQVLGLMEQLRHWVEKAMKWVKDSVFGKQGLTLEEFRDMPLRDLLDGEEKPSERGRGEEGDTRFGVREGEERKLDKDEVEPLISRMEQSAEVAPSLELTPENWEREFGKDKTVKTPLGNVKLGENQYIKLAKKDRREYFGMIKPTLENPDIIMEKYAPKEGAERDTKYLFVKTFAKPDGGRIVHFESVTVQQEGTEVSISSHEADRDALIKEMRNDKVLHLDKKLSPGSEWYLTETPNEGRPDLVPTSDNVSEGKVTTNPETTKENGENSGDVRFSTREAAEAGERAQRIVDEAEERIEERRREEEQEIYSGIGKVRNKADGREVEFYKSAFKKDTAAGGDLFIKAVPGFKESFENSVLAYSEEGRNAGEHRRDGSVHKEHKNIIGYHNYVGKVRMDGKDYYTRFTVTEEKGRERNGLHSAFVSSIDLYEKGTTPATMTDLQTLQGKHRERVADAKLREFFERARKAGEKVSSEGENSGEVESTSKCNVTKNFCKTLLLVLKSLVFPLVLR